MEETTINKVISGDYWIDADTGECLELVHQPKPEFHVTDRPSAEWVLERMQRHEAILASVELRRKALNENLDREAKREQNALTFLDKRFRAELQEFATAEIGKQKDKTYLTAFGALSLTDYDGGAITILNEAGAFVWAKKAIPEAVSEKTVEKLALNTLKKSKIELPADLFEVAPPWTKFEINTGIQKVGK
jgi:hypothetical protein